MATKEVQGRDHLGQERGIPDNPLQELPSLLDTGESPDMLKANNVQIYFPVIRSDKPYFLRKARWQDVGIQQITNLNSDDAENSVTDNNHGVTGVLPVKHGGTGIDYHGEEGSVLMSTKPAHSKENCISDLAWKPLPFDSKITLNPKSVSVNGSWFRVLRMKNPDGNYDFNDYLFLVQGHIFGGRNDLTGSNGGRSFLVSMHNYTFEKPDALQFFAHYDVNDCISFTKYPNDNGIYLEIFTTAKNINVADIWYQTRQCEQVPIDSQSASETPSYRWVFKGSSKGLSGAQILQYGESLMLHPRGNGSQYVMANGKIGTLNKGRYISISDGENKTIDVRLQALILGMITDYFSDLLSGTKKNGGTYALAFTTIEKDEEDEEDEEDEDSYVGGVDKIGCVPIGNGSGGGGNNGGSGSDGSDGSNCTEFYDIIVTHNALIENYLIVDGCIRMSNAETISKLKIQLDLHYDTNVEFNADAVPKYTITSEFGMFGVLTTNKFVYENNVICGQDDNDLHRIPATMTVFQHYVSSRTQENVNPTLKWLLYEHDNDYNHNQMFGEALCRANAIKDYLTYFPVGSYLTGGFKNDGTSGDWGVMDSMCSNALVYVVGIEELSGNTPTYLQMTYIKNNAAFREEYAFITCGITGRNSDAMHFLMRRVK